MIVYWFELQKKAHLIVEMQVQGTSGFKLLNIHRPSSEVDEEVDIRIKRAGLLDKRGEYGVYTPILVIGALQLSNSSVVDWKYRPAESKHTKLDD